MNELPDLGSRVEAVCRELSTDDSADDTDPGEHRVNSILRAFARHGLLDLVCSHRGGAIDRRNIREMATVINLLAANSGLFASVYMVNAILGGALVSLAGTEQQKVELLPALQKGRHQLAFAMTEPEAGSDAAGIKATATQEGDDFLLQGEKLYTTGAASADSIIVVARTAEHSTSRHALTLFLVPRPTEGLEIEPLQKLAANSHASCRVVLRNVRAAPDQVVGGTSGVGSAWQVLRVLGSIERLMVASMAAGLATAVVERAIGFAKTREQFGRRIASFQSIQHTLVDMHITAAAMGHFVDAALSAFEQGSDSAEAVCMAKAYCSEHLQVLVAQGMRVVGGRGYFEFERMSRYYREAPFTLYAGGTVEIQKMLIARSLGLDGGAGAKEGR